MDRTDVVIREISFTEIIKVHQLYERLSPDSKRTYRSTIFGIPRSPIWFIAQIFIINSYLPIINIRILINMYKYIIFGAFNKDTFLGFVSVAIHNLSSSERRSVRLGIAVDDCYQGKGIGSMLLSAMITRCRDEGLSTIYLDVADTNQRGITLYKNYGFTPLFTSRERDINVIRMELLL